MFKKVEGSDLDKFDMETRDLYARRISDPKLSFQLSRLTRQTRNYLPVIVDRSNPYVQEEERAYNRIIWNWTLGAAFFVWACHEFTKIYFPYGIILRKSIPTTWFQYARYRLPMLTVFLWVWYHEREYPRTQRIDLTSDTE